MRRAGLAVAVVLAGCVPARWPAGETPPTPVPPVASSPRKVKTVPPPPPATPAPASPAQAPAPPAEPAPRAGNPPFYDVLGVRYFVRPDSEGYREQGVASWYGAPFHGRRTSSGDVYDMHDFTAAHKTLPLPSRVRVTNLDNGRSVIVTVNDRGPFVKDRLIDLSYAAAKELGIVQSGTAPVEVAALDGPREGAIDQLFLQVGAYGEEANAARLKSQLEASGVSKVVIRYDGEVSPALYRVRIGPIADSAEYDALAAQMAVLRIANPRLVTESPVARSTPTE
jgi:rare lipoprotein A